MKCSYDNGRMSCGKMRETEAFAHVCVSACLNVSAFLAQAPSVSRADGQSLVRYMSLYLRNEYDGL